MFGERDADLEAGSGSFRGLNRDGAADRSDRFAKLESECRRSSVLGVVLHRVCGYRA
jgi:hypothetical protein